MKGTYIIAGVNVLVSTIYDGFHFYAKDYISDSESIDFEVITSREDIDRERSKSNDDSFHESYLEALAVFRKISERMPEYDTFLFHGSAISVDGNAYIFTAPSGTGKSTHSALWRKIMGERAVMVNDDKPMIHAEPGASEVFGTPFNGKHNLGSNIHVPLRAVCIIGRSETNHIESVTADDVYPALLRQTYRPHDTAMLAKTLSLLDRMKASVNFYRLYCNMNPEAAKVSWEAMRP